MKIVLTLFLILFSNTAFAKCRCVCIDGKSQQICDSGIDVKTYCGYQYCSKY